MKKDNAPSVDTCYIAGRPSETIENHAYKLNESLLYDDSRKNKILFSKTDNLMPNFVANLLQYI